MEVTTILDLLALLLFAAGLAIGLWVLFGPWALCWTGMFLGASSWVISKRQADE